MMVGGFLACDIPEHSNQPDKPAKPRWQPNLHSQTTLHADDSNALHSRPLHAGFGVNLEHDLYLILAKHEDGALVQKLLFKSDN